MNCVYNGWHVDNLLDRMNELSIENDRFRQLLIEALKSSESSEGSAWESEVQAALEGELVAV